MRKQSLLLLLMLLLFTAGALAAGPASAPTSQPAATRSAVYEYRPPSRGGTGKFYMGREIARVMGHQGAAWLERPERQAEEKPETLIEDMQLQPTDIVADIGAGTGYFTFRMAPLVPKGKVLAVDIQPEMLEAVQARAKELGITNVEPVLGEAADPMLPEAGVDVVLLVDSYHEFDHPREMMERIVRALKPGGRVVQVEYRGEDADVPIKPLHKMTERQARREMHAVGLEHVRTLENLPRQHVMIFQKPAAASAPATRPATR